jgi:pimeloyl-ACP methyl ester carboxylesterase
MWPLLMAKIFGPRSVPKKFGGFPKEMALRPSQIHASAAESALMIPDAFHFRDEYSNLKMPVVIVAGDEDRLVDIDAQSTRLHRDVPQSRFHRVPTRQNTDRYRLQAARWTCRAMPMAMKS